MKVIRTTFPLVLLIGSAALSLGQGFPTQSGTSTATNIFSPVPNAGVLTVYYDFFTQPDSMDVYYDDVNIFSSGITGGTGLLTIPYGPGLSTSITIIIDQGYDPGPGDLWQYQVTDVPEPGSLTVFDLGFSVLVMWVARRKRP